MNKEKLKNIIKKYKQHISNNYDIEAINERKRKDDILSKLDYGEDSKYDRR